jgi:hypothetical protein
MFDCQLPIANFDLVSFGVVGKLVYGGLINQVENGNRQSAIGNWQCPSIGNCLHLSRAGIAVSRHGEGLGG